MLDDQSTFQGPRKYTAEETERTLSSLRIKDGLHWFKCFSSYSATSYFCRCAAIIRVIINDFSESKNMMQRRTKWIGTDRATSMLQNVTIHGHIPMCPLSFAQWLMYIRSRDVPERRSVAEQDVDINLRRG